MTLFLSLFVMPSFAEGVVVTPTKILDRSEYTTALNSIALVIMNWYGSLISIDKNKPKYSNFDAESVDSLNVIVWRKYRSQYPKNISQIIITSTELLKFKESGDYQFKVNSKITYKKNNKTLTQLLHETFLFKSSLLRHEKFSHKNDTVIKNITQDKKEAVNNIKITGFDRSHYKVREFTYSWLTYIDGVNTLKSTMNAKAWLDKASYSLKMGGEELTGSIKSVIEKKKQLLAKGGHLLHSLEIKHADANTFIIDLILEWKGVNKTGKPVIARIHQEIKVKISKDNTWEVLSVKEEHLLPIIAPWMGLVC